jgi:hypothetical protein
MLRWFGAASTDEMNGNAHRLIVQCTLDRCHPGHPHRAAIHHHLDVMNAHNKIPISLSLETEDLDHCVPVKHHRKPESPGVHPSASIRGARSAAPACRQESPWKSPRLGQACLMGRGWLAALRTAIPRETPSCILHPVPRSSWGLAVRKAMGSGLGYWSTAHESSHLQGRRQGMDPASTKLTLPGRGSVRSPGIAEPARQCEGVDETEPFPMLAPSLSKPESG